MVPTRNDRPQRPPGSSERQPPDELDSLEETTEILALGPTAVRAIREAEGELDAGSGVGGAELRAKYLKR